MKLFSKMCGRLIVALLLASFGGRALGEVLTVDASEWYETGTGETVSGWSVTGITEYATPGGAKFDAKSDVAVSPLFDHSVTQVVATVLCGQESTQRFLTIAPTAGEGTARQAAATKAYAPQTFVWRADEGVRQIKFFCEGSGNAYWGVRDVTVWTDRIEAPVPQAEDPKWRNAFHARWQAEPLAVSHEIQVYRVVRIPPQGEWRHRWDFSVLTNATGNTKDFANLSPPDSLSDVGGTNLCLQGKAGGHLQIGKSELAGVMVLPLGASGEGGVNRTGLMRLFKHAADGGSDVSLAWEDVAGETNSLATVSVTTEPTEFRLGLPDEAVALWVLSSKSRRVRVESVDVVSDYVPGFSVTNLVARHHVAPCEKLVRNLEPGDWIWRVRSFDAARSDSPWSDYRAVTLGPDDPERRAPGLQVSVR